MSPRNREYADKHGFEYLEIKENLYKYRNSYTWLKFTIIEQMIDEGYVTDGDIVTHLEDSVLLILIFHMKQINLFRMQLTLVILRHESELIIGHVK